MKITINLSGLRESGEVLFKFGEVLEFGGPNGNMPINKLNEGRGWGLNWDALADSLRLLEKGGIWGISKNFQFPLKIDIKNYREFQENDSEGFQMLKKILTNQAEEYAKENKILKIDYVY